MRILFISTMAGSSWGGSEELWTRSADYALDEGHEVIISVYDWGKEHSQIAQLRAKNAKINLRRRIFYGDSLLQKVRGKICQIVFSRRQIRRLARYHPDIIFVSQGTIYECMFPWFWDLVERSNAKLYIITQANTEYNTIPMSCIAIGRLLVKRAEAMYFVSNRNREVAERQLAMKFSNANVISNPANLKSYKYCDWSMEGGLSMAFVGRLNSTVKGIGVLLEILGQPKWRDRDWRLNIYGKGKDREYLLELTEHFGIQDRVIFKGFVNDVGEIWAKNHVLVLASTVEGTPLALIEAMLCGRAAVVSDVGGNAELVDDNISGFIAEAPSVRSFGNAMERMWQKRRELLDMGVSAKMAIGGKVDLDSYKKLVDAVKDI